MTSWDEGFDAGMEGEMHPAHLSPAHPFRAGWFGAMCYRSAIRTRPAEPRDTEIDDIKEFLECQPK